MKIVRVTSKSDWEAYHQIRRHVLFELRGLTGYDDQHPDDHRPENLPLILVEETQAVGALRIDVVDNGHAIVRTVAIVPEKQRQGLGRIMLDYVETLARMRGLAMLNVYAASDAVGFYERLGWKMVDADRTTPLMLKCL